MDTILTGLTHTVITLILLTIHTVVVLVTTLMVTVRADLDGEDSVMVMAGTETEMVGMAMAVDGEAQTEAVKHQM